MNQVTPSQDRQPTTSQRTRQEPALWPPVDVIEDAGGITLVADMPGVPRDKLNLRVEADTLTIEGDLGIEMPQGMEANHAEVQLARYRRAFTLSKELDADKVSAELAQGVLRVRIPKAEHAQPRKITVNVG
jgi:HSP20 family protein